MFRRNILSPSGSESHWHIPEDSNIHYHRCQRPRSSVRTFPFVSRTFVLLGRLLAGWRIGGTPLSYGTFVLPFRQRKGWTILGSNRECILGSALISEKHIQMYVSPWLCGINRGRPTFVLNLFKKWGKTIRVTGRGGHRAVIRWSFRIF
jgi:hypothetical protein